MYGDGQSMRDYTYIDDIIDGTLGEVARNKGYEIYNLGDLSNKLNLDQLELIGRVDIALAPIGGRYTMDAATVVEVVTQLKPKIAVPMHYWNNVGALDTFTGGLLKARFFPFSSFTVSKESLPATITISVLKSPGRWIQE